jgi:hypothetical protein
LENFKKVLVLFLISFRHPDTTKRRIKIIIYDAFENTVFLKDYFQLSRHCLAARQIRLFWELLKDIPNEEGCKCGT